MDAPRNAPPSADAHAASGSLTLAADLNEIARGKAWLEGLGRRNGLDDDGIYRLSLCAEELLTNTITHGYDPGVRGTIRMHLALQGPTATLTIEDEGRAFDPTTVPPPKKPASLEEAQIGGVGLHLVRQFSSRLEYRRQGATNQTVVRFGPQ